MFRLSITSIALLCSFSAFADPIEEPLITPDAIFSVATTDWNNDGIEDLYIFDRAANVHLCFLHDGVVGSTNYTFASEYAANFPDLQHFVLLRDYNQDGIQDLFAFSDVPGASSMPDA